MCWGGEGSTIRFLLTPTSSFLAKKQDISGHFVCLLLVIPCAEFCSVRVSLCTDRYRGRWSGLLRHHSESEKLVI